MKLNKRDISLLIADDNEYFRVTLQKFLKDKFSGIKIIQARNGIEVLKQTKEYYPDLIILDVKMQEMNGFEAAVELKKEFPFIPIIILTNYDEYEYRIEAKKALVDAFIVKKNLISELPHIINTLMLSTSLQK